MMNDKKGVNFYKLALNFKDLARALRHLPMIFKSKTKKCDKLHFPITHTYLQQELCRSLNIM